jgi:GTP-binding protein Era
MTESEPSNPEVSATRTGYVTLLGRPNAGKSTLLNRLIGQHLSIVTSKAQTTWQRVTGILTVDSDQLIFLDTPGLLEAKDLLQRAMLGAALEALSEADIVLLVIDAGRRPDTKETERIERALEEARAPIVVALNKIDEAPAAMVAAWDAWLAHNVEGPVHHISALEGDGAEALLAEVREKLPAGPFLYPEDDIASDPVRFFVAELVRECIFEQYHQEIPYSVMCQVDEFREGGDPVYIQMNVFVERKSQKGIVIGNQGVAIRTLGTCARKKIEHFLGERVYLDLWVKPLKGWRKNRSHLNQLGFRIPEDE